MRGIPNYRKTLIKSISNLTYLDDRPVDEGDRSAAEAFFEGGLEAERKAREIYKKKKDIRFNVREAEKEYFQESFEERRRKALESLQTEYITRKTYLDQKKKKLLAEYDEFPEKKKELTQELSSIDFQIEENDKLKQKEETEYVSTMSKRAKMDKYSTFEYEDWMDSVLVTHVVENLFDFTRVVKLIQLDFKNKNVKNWELFNELDLRTKWTEIELKKFRKDEKKEYDFLVDETLKPNENTVGETTSKKIEIREGQIEDDDFDIANRNVINDKVDKSNLSSETRNIKENNDFDKSNKYIDVPDTNNDKNLDPNNKNIHYDFNELD